MKDPAREAMRIILKFKGCTLMDNDDIQVESTGEVVAQFQKAFFTNDGIQFEIKMLKALEYIEVATTVKV
jgi:hypothetical protein